MNSPDNATDNVAHIEALIRTIRETEEAIQALNRDQFKAVMSGLGRASLSHNAEEQRVRDSDAERAVSLAHRALLDALPAHLALVDANGVIRAVNASWVAFGATNGADDPADGVGANYLEVAGQAVGMSSEVAAEVAVGLNAVLSGEQETFALEYLCHALTEQGWLRVIITPVRDERIRGAVVMHLDVSEKRASEMALRQSEAQLRESRTLQLFAERMGRIGGWNVGLPDYDIVWSDQVCAIHSVPAGTHPTPKQALEMYSPEHRKTVQRAFEECAQHGTPFDIEAQVILEKQRKWVRAIGQAHREPTGEITAIQGALQDITDQKRLEQQFLRAQRMESVGTLAGGIAHDLNNVLTPILMSADLLRMTDSDPERIELIEGIHQAARRGADMVRQVLTFARGADGRRLPVRVNEIAREVEKIVRETFPRNIRVHSDLPPDVTPVLGDPTQLHQVFVNLCVNARDAMPHGGDLTLSVSEIMLDAQYAGMSTEAKPGPHIVMQIADTGTGMTQRVLERIFEPFFTTKELGKGTGLGLSTSVAIIKNHGGFIRAYSEAGAGTRFEVYLPVVNATGTQIDDAPTSSVPHGRGELILVVDDESAVRGITQQTLETFGYRVVVAADGAEGIAVFAAQQDAIRLILTDMMMPVMDGTALIEVIMRMDPSVRIIAASGLHTNGPALRVPSTRVREFLPKPYTAETLLMTVRRVLDA